MTSFPPEYKWEGMPPSVLPPHTNTIDKQINIVDKVICICFSSQKTMVLLNSSTVLSISKNKKVHTRAECENK